MITGGECADGLVRDEQRSDREPVGETLREGDEIGAHAELLEGEEAAGPSRTRLHLVEAEDGLELRGSPDEVRLERDHATLAEDRLEEDQADLVVDGGAQSRGVVRRNEAHAGQERSERSALRRLARRRERT